MVSGNRYTNTAKDPILFAGGDTDLYGYVLTLDMPDVCFT